MRSNSGLGWRLLAVGILTVVVFLSFVAYRLGTRQGITFTSKGPVIQEVQKLAALVTTRVQIADILTAQGATHQGVFIIKGDAVLGVDLSKLTDGSITAVNQDQKTARIVLPPPHVVMARVDHEKTRTWDVKRTTWIPFVGDPDLLRNEAMRQAQELVTHAANADEPMSMARAHAESVIATFYQGVGWRVTVSWTDDNRRARTSRP